MEGFDNLEDIAQGLEDNSPYETEKEDGEDYSEEFKDNDAERSYLESVRDQMNSSRHQLFESLDHEVMQNVTPHQNSETLSNGSKIWDFRHSELPEDCEVRGGHPAFEQQRDQSSALVLVPGARISLKTKGMKNGGEKLNNYSLTIDLKVTKPTLPKDGLSLYQSNSDPQRISEGEVYVYSSGGVGVFGEQGVESARVKPQKWQRVVITQRQGKQLTTYVNGRKCAAITAESRGVIGITDGRFAINPEEFFLFGSLKDSLMPGVQVKYVELAPVCMTDDEVKEQAQNNRIYSYWEVQERQRQERMFQGMSLQRLYKRAPPVWVHPAFLAAFGDAFLEGTSMEGGSSIPPSILVLSLALDQVPTAQRAYLEGFEHSQDQALSSVIEIVREGKELAKKFALGTKNGTQLVAFLKKLRAKLDQLKEGEKMLVPGGIGGHPVMFIVEREEAETFRFVTVNTHPLGGLDYHAASASTAPKIKYKTCLVLKGIPKDRIVNDAFWAMLLKLCVYGSKFNTPDRVYNLLLPFLVDKPLEAAMAEIQDDVCAEWRSPQRANVAYYRCCSEAVVYLLRRFGLDMLQTKKVLLALRMQYLSMAENDLQYVPAIGSSDLRVVRMACEQAAYASVKLSDKATIGTAQLISIKEAIERTEALSLGLPCSDAGSHSPPPYVELDEETGTHKTPLDHPFFERLLRTEDVNGLAGAPIVNPQYVPVDFLQLPTRVETLEEGLAALRHCDRLCTLISCQPYHLKNISFLKASLIQYVMTYLVPVPKSPSSPQYHECIWSTPMRYALQLDIAIILQRIMEHFSASVFSLKANRSFDAVRIIVPACIAAICDVVLRKRATDIPSDLCLALKGDFSGQGFGLSTGMFGSQSETIEVHTAELNIARTSVLDYFDAQNHLEKIFPWEEGNQPDQNTMGFLATLSRQLAYPQSGEALISYVWDDHALVIKNYPEFGCYRDIAFYFKYFLNTDEEAFPPPIVGGDYSQRQAELSWRFDQGQFLAMAYRMPLACRPKPPKTFTHRFPSAATPSFLTAPHQVETEDDVLHIKNLPSFDEALGQADSELLISYLTVPYIRIPLVLTFFSTEDRIHSLRSKELQNVIDSVLFEPGRYLSRNANQVPQIVPETNKKLLATPYGLILNELHRSPKVVIDAICQMLKLALDLDTGTVHSSTTDIILYVIRTVARVENFITFLINYATKKHETLPTSTVLRDVEVTPIVLELLQSGLEQIRGVLRGPVHIMLEAWTMELMEECEDKNDDEIFDRNSRIACGLHAHILLIYRNILPQELTAELVCILMCSFIFLNTRHAWNMELLSIPETEIYELLAVCRRKVVVWTRTVADQEGLNEVMEAVVRVSAGTGVRRSKDQDARRRWGFIQGDRSYGRFTVAPRVFNRQFVWGAIPEIQDSTQFGTEVDFQNIQLTLKSSHLKALDKTIAGRPDVVQIFGTHSMQASTVESTEHREWVHLIGRNHDIQFWKTPDPRPCLQEFDRDYSPGELEESEEWIVPIFEPVRLTYMMKPFPLQICLPEDPLPAGAEVAIMIGIHPKNGGTWKEIFVFRTLGVVHVYNVHSHGRRFYQSLEYTSDVRFCLREMQPSVEDRQSPWPKWERFGAGHPYGQYLDPTSVVITRGWDHPENLSGGEEQFIPQRLLHGIVPSALLDTYLFWQDEEDNLKGYPIEENGAFLISITLKPTEQIEATLSPGQVACIKRLLKKPQTTEYQHALGAIEKLNESQLISGDWQMTFTAFQALRGLVRKHGGSEGLLNCLNILKDSEQEFEDVNGLLGALDLVMPSATPMYVVEDSGSKPKSLDQEELTLLNLLYATPGTRLFDVAQSITRIENASYVLPWTRNATSDLGKATIDLLELPRLKLSFHEKKDGSGKTRLYSMDHSNLFVAENNSPVIIRLLNGLPHSLFLATTNGEVQILVPCIDPVRPQINSSPFSTELVLNRANGDWQSVLDTAYYLYPVHISLSFLFCPTLASSIYLLLLRFLNRDYDAVFRLVESIGTDAEFSPEELSIFQALQYCNNDAHPNAHACRLKISLVTIDSPVSCPWDLTRNMSRVITKLSHVSSSCRLTHKEELQLLEYCILSPEDPRFDPKIYTVYEVTLNRNRKFYLESLLAQREWAPVFLVPRTATDGWPNRADFSILEASPADWGQVSLNYAAPQSLSGVLSLDFAHKFWSNQETLQGNYVRAGFLFLYELLTGTRKVKILKDDVSATYAALLFQLYGDCSQSSFLASVLNVLIRNPLLRHKVPVYKDNRKYKNPTVNAWPDEEDSSSPLSELFEMLQPIVLSELTNLRMGEDSESFPKLHEPSQTCPVVPDGPRDWLIPKLTDYACQERNLVALSGGAVKQELQVNEDDLRAFASSPLQSVGLDEYIIQVSRSEMSLDQVPHELPFEVSSHKEADSEPARLMITRLEADMKTYADRENNHLSTRCSFLLDSHISVIAAATNHPDAAVATAKLKSLEKLLEEVKARDQTYIAAALAEIEAIANEVPLEGVAEAPGNLEKVKYLLKRYSGQESKVWLEFLFGALLSSTATVDLTTVNPFLDENRLPLLMNLVMATILHVSRNGQCNRCLDDITACKKLLQKLNAKETSDKETIIGLKLKSESLATNLSAQRYFIEGMEGESTPSFDPSEPTPSFDPRFLVFEFTWNILLREAQVALVREIMGSIRKGVSIVKQMLMGGGKTTVVAPLIAVMLDDGKSLVAQVVPPALLEFSRSIMRSTFSSIMKKRIYTLSFDRTTEANPNIYRKLENAIETHGVVISTPTCVKSIMLKFLETMDLIKDDTRPRHPDMEKDMRELGQILRLFQEGVLIMDEVDLILHPMKSELNFPIGEKHDLDFSPLRWQLPIHLLDAVFYAERHKMSVGFKSSKRAVFILDKILEIIQEGYRLRALQRNPHIVLLNPEWYHEQMKPVMAEWLHLWLQSQHLSGLTEAEMIQYMLEGANIFKNADLAAKIEETLLPKHKKMLNLAHDWLRSFLPHVLQKIDRVSFGIFNKGDYERALKMDPHMPRSRAKLGIPFVGKDVPSRSSEFAHPDIIIGLTILAYRYEGLRWTDFEDVIGTLQSTLTKEIGPFSQRKSSLRHESWVKEAGGRIKGQTVTYDLDESDMADTEGKYNDPLEVVPLRLLKRSNDEQMRKLYDLIYELPDAVHWYLESFVFPTFMRHQIIKLSACGQEVGGDMLFKRRIGFSGTPSDLLPIELGRCGYEKGSDGLMIYVLTDPRVTSYEVVEEDWTVHSLLDKIAAAQDPHYNALIDTGALITGMTNYEVARYLLDHGLPWCEGVVFLDEFDRKMILVRATGRVLKLAQCGIPAEQRFAFYDQVHTTGMDIKHTHNAKAIMTLGKDMVFRDYAQGAFRMRGINKGQTIHVFIIPEVERLMQRELGHANMTFTHDDGSNSVLIAITAWLVINSMRSERVQFNQLCLQNVANVWRKNAFAKLLWAYEGFSIKNPAQEADLVLGLGVFCEGIDFSLEAGVPTPVAFGDAIEAKVKQQERFIGTDGERGVIDRVIGLVKGSLLDEADQTLNAEMVQEQEEEKEKQQEQEQEQEIEIEKYVDLAYSRDHEAPTPWPFSALGNTEMPAFFYDAKDFKLYKRRPLNFPDFVKVSDNYFDKRWSGARRIKNAVMVLEWLPSVAQLVPSLTPSAPEDDQQMQALEQAIDLFDQDNSNTFDNEELKKLIKAISNQELNDEQIAKVVESVGGKAEGVNNDELMQLIVMGQFREYDEGRQYVLLSLAEAETIRRIMHLRLEKPVLEGRDTSLALRCIPAQNIALDTSYGFAEAKYYQQEAAHQSIRFLDCVMYFNPRQLNILVQALQGSTARRRRMFFTQVIGCRRRLARKWQDTPINTLFKLAHMFALFRQKAQIVRIRESIKNKGMFLYDAFIKFDFDRNGLLSPGEFFGAVDYLEIPQFGPEDVLDFIDLADTTGDGNISYRELVEVLTDPEDAEKGNTAEEDATALPALGRLVSTRLVEPKGDELLAKLKDERTMREIQLEEEEEQLEQSEESKVQEELKAEEDEADRLQEGGRNPKIEGTNVHYSFTTGRRPRGLTSRGDFKYEEDIGELKILKAFPQCVLFCPVPFEGNAGGINLNCYSVTMEVKFESLPLAGQLTALLSTSQYNESDAKFYIDSQGRIGRGTSFGTGDVALKAKQWHVVTLSVDCVAGEAQIFIDSFPANRIEPSDMTIDGPYSIPKNVCIFGSKHKDECKGGSIRMLMVDAHLLSQDSVNEVCTTIKTEKETYFKMMVTKMLISTGIGPDIAAWAVEASSGSTVEARVQSALDIVYSAS